MIETTEQYKERNAGRLDTKRRMEVLLPAFCEHLKDTAVIKEKNWSKDDVDKTRELLVDVAPFAHPKVNPSYWEHLLIASIYGRKVAERVGSPKLNPYEAEVMLLLHDFGRLVSPHRYLRNDIIANIIFRQAAMRQYLQEKFYPIFGILGLKRFGESPITDIKDMTLAQRIVDVVDNIGKKGPDGILFTPDTLKEYSRGHASRYTGGVWTSERRGRKAMSESGKQKFALELTLTEIEWLENTFGIDFYSLREKVVTEFVSFENQDFLLRLKNRQETLDADVDLLLHRSPIETVVFDIGDVLFQGKRGEVLDDELVRRISSFFNRSKNDIISIFEVLHHDGMTGRLSGEEYLKKFWVLAGKNPPVNPEQLQKPFVHLDIYKPNQEMQWIVRALSKNPALRCYILSNVVSPFTWVLKQRLGQFYPEILQKNIFLSSEIGFAKGINDQALWNFIAKKTKTDFSSILFIDNTEQYTAIARVNFGVRGFTFRGNPHRNLSAAERLKPELQKAQLIL